MFEVLGELASVLLSPIILVPSNKKVETSKFVQFINYACELCTPELWTFPYSRQIAGPSGLHLTEVPTAMATQYSEGAHSHM